MAIDSLHCYDHASLLIPSLHSRLDVSAQELYCIKTNSGEGSYENIEDYLLSFIWCKGLILMSLSTEQHRNKERLMVITFGYRSYDHYRQHLLMH